MKEISIHLQRLVREAKCPADEAHLKAAIAEIESTDAVSVYLTEDQRRILWGVLLFARTLGDRIIVGKEILGIWPDDLMDDECPLCRRELDEEDE
jgi:hypothetical protein